MSVCVAAQFLSRGSRWLLSHPLFGVFLCAWFDAGAFGEETGKESVWPELRTAALLEVGCVSLGFLFPLAGCEWGPMQSDGSDPREAYGVPRCNDMFGELPVPKLLNAVDTYPARAIPTSAISS